MSIGHKRMNLPIQSVTSMRLLGANKVLSEEMIKIKQDKVSSFTELYSSEPSWYR